MSVLSRVLLLSLALPSMAVLMTGCPLTLDPEGLEFGGDNDGFVSDGNNGGDGRVTAVQTFAPGGIRLDMLWVVDDSGSMCDKQKALSNNIDLLVQALDELDADVNFAVVTTDMDNPDFGGQFAVVNPGSQCAGNFDCNRATTRSIINTEDYRSTGTLDRTELTRDLGCLLAPGNSGSGTEKGLDAARTALSEPLINGLNSGFLRPEAFLAVVFVSDEDDCSDGGRSDNFNCQDNLTPSEDFVDFFVDLKGNAALVSVNGIIAPRAVGNPGNNQVTTCSSPELGDGAAGERYADVIEAFGGQTPSVCDPAYNRAIEDIAKQLQSQFATTTCLAEFPAACLFASDCPDEQSCTLAGDNAVHCSDFLQVFVTGPELIGNSCQPDGGLQRCELTRGLDYTINFGDDACNTGTSVSLVFEPRAEDSVELRYLSLQ